MPADDTHTYTVFALIDRHTDEFIPAAVIAGEHACLDQDDLSSPYQRYATSVLAASPDQAIALARHAAATST